ncbi:MAG TPA: hypothetical protein VK183_03715 [Flavobacterium sp.]|nr:hypothetical protein [Flavobacterium sp.]
MTTATFALALAFFLAWMVDDRRKNRELALSESQDFTEMLRFIAKYEQVDTARLQQILQIGNTDANEVRAIQKILEERRVSAYEPLAQS